jgi:deoxyadenosine/deoxycytidine kinase
MEFNKIAICGSHSCGKTTLLNALHKVSMFETYPVIHELAAKFEPRSRESIEVQFRIMQNQAHAERVYIENYGKFLSDRSILDNIAYCTNSHNQIMNRNPKGEEIYKRCYALSYNHLHKLPPAYDLLIFVDEILPFKHATHRAYSDHKTQQFIYDYIKNELKQLPIASVFVSGTTEQRIDTIIDFLSYNMRVK